MSPHLFYCELFRGGQKKGKASFLKATGIFNRMNKWHTNIIVNEAAGASSKAVVGANLQADILIHVVGQHKLLGAVVENPALVIGSIRASRPAGLKEDILPDADCGQGVDDGAGTILLAGRAGSLILNAEAHLVLLIHEIDHLRGRNGS